MTDQDSKQGNDRIAKAEFIREEMRQTGCLAIDAAKAWAALNVCSKCGIDDGRRFDADETLVRDNATGEVFCAFCADELSRLVHGKRAEIRHRDGEKFSFISNPYPNSPQPFDEGDRTERLEQLAESQRHPRDESGF